MRNPPEALKMFSDATKNEDVRITMPTYIGSNTPYLSIPYMQYNLRGQGNFRKMYLDPPILDYKEPLLINKPYTTSIIMRKEKNKDSKNLSEGQATLYKKKIWVESVSDETFEVIIDTKKFDESTSSEDDIDISVTIQSTTTGVKTAYLRVEIEDGAPLSYFIQAEFDGPLISIVEPCVEFGLQKVNTQVSFTMNVQNHSSVEAPIFIKNGNDFQDFSYIQYCEAYDEEENKQKNPSKVLSGAGGKRKKKKNLKIIKTTGGNKISFAQQKLTIPANSRSEITVKLDCTSEEVISEILQILVKDGSSQFIYLNANIQTIKVCLSRYNIDLGLIYAGIKQNIDSRHSQCVVMKNYGNLAAKFDWNEQVIPDKWKIQFDPPRGTLEPHQELVVNVKLTAFSGGDMHQIFTCDVADFDYPLGFVLKANVYGLRVCHMLPDYVVEAQKAALSMTNTAQSKLLTTKNFKGIEDVKESEDVKDEEKLKLKSLKFPSCTINKPSSQRFILKNMSGIKTTFNFKSKEYEPDDLVLPVNIKGQSSLDNIPNQDIDESLTISKPGSRSSKRETKIRFALSTKTKKGLKVKQLKRALLTDSHEHQNKFQSKTGETFTATKRLEREQAFYLSNNKGLAIVFSPHFGELKPHEEIPVDVTIYNNA